MRKRERERERNERETDRDKWETQSQRESEGGIRDTNTHTEKKIELARVVMSDSQIIERNYFTIYFLSCHHLRRISLHINAKMYDHMSTFSPFLSSKNQIHHC